MLSQQIGSLVALCKASGISIEPLAPNFFQKFPARQFVGASVGSMPSDEESQHFLDVFANEIAGWAKLGQLPRDALRPLLELVDSSLTEIPETISPEFFKKLLNWAKLVESSPVEDVKSLYGQTVQIGEKKYYLIEILTKYFDGSRSVKDHKMFMFGIARWLCQYDASLISGARELEEIYTDLKIGPAFCLDRLRELLHDLPAAKGSNVKAGISLLLVLLEGKISIDADIMEALFEIFRLRWSQILKDESASTSNSRLLKSYFACETGDNQAWISLARTVCGAGWMDLLQGKCKPKGNPAHFRNNYLRLLMPTLTHDVDHITLAGLTDYHLSDLILSHDRRCAVPLRNSADAMAAGATAFYNHSGCHPRPFTAIEIQRMSKAHPRFHPYIAQARYDMKTSDLPIYKETVDALKKLVNSCTFVNGLQVGEKYTEEQMDAAGRAYHLFYNFMKQLRDRKESEHDNEIDRLLSQRIVFGSTDITFAQVINDVDENREDGCIAGCNRLLVALILRYNKDAQFNPEIEAIIERYKMRESVTKEKMYRIDDREATRRLQIITVSMMSHFFKYSMFGHKVSIGGCYNTMSEVTYRVFQFLQPIINGNKLKLKGVARHAYAAILETFVKPVVAGMLPVRADTLRWFQSIKDGSLFEQHHSWFKPEMLLSTLFPLAQKNPVLYSKVEGFLDQLLIAYAQRRHPSDLKELTVNIKFAQFIEDLDEKTRTQLLTLLVSQKNTIVTSEEFSKLYVDYLIRRLACIGATPTGGWGFSLFSRTAVPDQLKMPLIMDTLREGKPASVEETFHHLYTKITMMTAVICNSREKEAMIKYLAEIRSGMLAPTASSQQRARSPIPGVTEFFSVIPSGCGRPTSPRPATPCPGFEEITIAVR